MARRENCLTTGLTVSDAKKQTTPTPVLGTEVGNSAAVAP